MRKPADDRAGSASRSMMPTSARYQTVMPATAPARSHPSARPTASHLLRFAGAEDPSRSEDQDQDQDREGDHSSEFERGRDVVSAEQQVRTDRLGYPQDHAADRSSRDAADPPENGRRERSNTGQEAHRRTHLAELRE